MQYLRGEVHPTWVFTAVCYGLIAGIVASFWLWVPAVAGVGLGAACVVWAFWRARRAFLVVAFIGAALIGTVRGSVGQGEVAQYRPLYGQAATVSGRVLEDVDIDSGRETRIRVGDVMVNGQDYPGQVWLSVYGQVDNIRRSDRVTVTGSLREGFGNFKASISGGKLERIEHPVPGDVALVVRDSFADSIRRVISQPGADLGIGFMLGQKSMLPPELLENLRIVGLTHIVVASGYNLSILVRFCRRRLSRVSKYLTTLLSALTAGSFVFISGISPSMVRAAIVTGFSLWAWYFGRKFHPVTLLGLAAALTLAYNPSYIWGDVGWQLSFAAFAGVMIVAPLLTAYFFGNDKPPLMVQILFETFAATVVTVPIIIMTFGTFSNVALLANLLILPLIPFTMGLLAVAGVAGYLGLTLFGWAPDLILRAMIWVVDWCAELPWAESAVAWPWWGAAAYVVLLVAGCVYLRWRTGYRLYQVNIVE